MPLMIWNERMSVGVAAIDDQHKTLVSLLNELGDSMQAGKSKEALGAILDSLISYTETHFKYEEDLFSNTTYPDTVIHKKEHEDLVQRALDIQAKYKAGSGSALSVEVLTFLKNWLTTHIMGTDKKYTVYMHAAGIK